MSSSIILLLLNLVLLLSTASALAFPAARTHAISALDAASPPLDPVERVFLAEKYAIPAWLRPAYVALCSRAHALEDAEAEVLGAAAEEGTPPRKRRRTRAAAAAIPESPTVRKVARVNSQVEVVITSTPSSRAPSGSPGQRKRD